MFLISNYISLPEPALAPDSETRRECKLLMLFPLKKDRRSGVAKTFTTILPPGSGALRDVAVSESVLAYFRRPAQFPPGFCPDFAGEQAFPIQPARIAEFPPGKMQKFVDEDSAQLARPPQQGLIQNNPPFPQEGSGVYSNSFWGEFSASHPQPGPKLNSNHLPVNSAAAPVRSSIRTVTFLRPSKTASGASKLAAIIRSTFDRGGISSS